MSLLKSTVHARLLETGSVVTLELPDGVKVGLSPGQAAHAIIEQHGNFGRSKVTVRLQLELEVCGPPDAIKQHIARKLAGAVEELREANDALRSKLRARQESASLGERQGERLADGEHGPARPLCAGSGVVSDEATE
jgi:hypothetical protein